MLIYWALFGYFAVGALLTTNAKSAPAKLFLAMGAIVTALLIGLRYRVGADWENYEFIFDYASRFSLGRALRLGDPGYQLVNWTVAWLDVRIWLVNVICGAIFTWGLFRFCRAQPFPWLAALVATPYMIIVVAMGYTRQAVALGILMAGLADFQKGASTLRFALYVTAAAFFHKTAVVVMPLVAMSSTRNRLVNLAIAIAAGVLLYDLFLGDSMDKFVEHYIKTAYSSQGAGIRVAMNMVAAALFWIGYRRFQFTDTERKLWRNFSFAAVGFLVLLFVLPSSTAVDRMSLYIMPLQVAVLSQAPSLTMDRRFGLILVIAYAGAVQFTWLNFAIHAHAWVPYQFFPLFGT